MDIVVFDLEKDPLVYTVNGWPMFKAKSNTRECNYSHIHFKYKTFSHRFWVENKILASNLPKAACLPLTLYTGLYSDSTENWTGFT